MSRHGGFIAGPRVGVVSATIWLAPRRQSPQRARPLEVVYEFENKRKRHLLAALSPCCCSRWSGAAMGFFVDPTLTIAGIGPQTLTLIEGNRVSKCATGTYDDGTSKDLTGKVSGLPLINLCVGYQSVPGKAPATVPRYVTTMFPGFWRGNQRLRGPLRSVQGRRRKIALTAEPTNRNSNIRLVPGDRHLPGGTQDITTLGDVE